MTVYVLHVIWAANRELAAVCSSPEKCEQFKRLHPASEWSSIAEYEAPEIVELDAGLELAKAAAVPLPTDNRRSHPFDPQSVLDEMSKK